MSSACCTLPPVQAEYTPKGEYIEVAGLKTYAVGPEDAKAAILFVYDIFGFSPQILQGADLLASQGFRIVMPDFLVGKYATAELFAPGHEAERDAYFSGFPGSLPSQSKPVADVAKYLKAKHSAVGVIGTCWGYKAVILSEGVGEFEALAGIHPSFSAVEDAEKINVPLCLIPTKDEDMSIVNKIYENVEAKNPGKNFMKHFDTHQHGFMAARGSVDGGPRTEAYHEGYTILSTFFKKYLKV
ncbi:Alpha/Beta hydrolase protein [Naematelia encephala]|uniref:Alpha/Beta hydrolase protein n=1 Tax=Naematelia encephala TaxID=71784 RepID=A0A1Y2B510_9TREE|nr:Alpha/Beta hydrolase protein [Naematelia encephala]